MGVDVIAGGRLVTVEVEGDDEVAILLLAEAGGDSGVVLRPGYVNPVDDFQYLLRDTGAMKARESDDLALSVTGFPKGTLRFRAAPFLAQVARACSGGGTKASLTPKNAGAWGLEP